MDEEEPTEDGEGYEDEEQGDATEDEEIPGVPGKCCLTGVCVCPSYVRAHHIVTYICAYHIISNVYVCVS